MAAFAEKMLTNLNSADAAVKASALEAGKRNGSRALAVCLNRTSRWPVLLGDYSAELRTSLANAEVSDLRRAVVAAAQAPAEGKSWAVRMLNFGFQAVLKRINEEAAEFVSAVCCGYSEGACKEAADTIYHVLLLLVALGLDPAELLRDLGLRSGWGSPFCTLGILEPLAASIHDSIVYGRNRAFVAGWRTGRAVRVMINNLYHAVFCLTFLCARLGMSTCVDTCAVCRTASDVFVCLMVLLRYRRIRYQQVVNELYARMNAKPNEALKLQQS
ncbi:MAG: phosphoribosyl-ATP diphosphatase [Candidatus Hodgkinia cicadicola]